MPKKVTKIGVMTSGGDAPGMNACIRAVVRTGIFHGLEVYGITRGYSGLIDNDIQKLDSRSVANIIQRGGTILKTARCKEFMTPEGRKKAYNNLKKLGINGLVIIGGDGSFKGAQIFSNEFDIPCIGIPGTIDKDIAGTDFTIGFDTAVNTAIDAIDKIRDTADAHDRLFIVEVMGRDAGHIALNAGIGAGAEEILIPEEDFGLDRLVESLKRSKGSGKTSSIVVVSEGDKIGKNVFELKDYIEENMPEYYVRVAVLGHMQRGGSPSCFDRVLASRLGVKAVETLLDGKSNYMVGLNQDKITLTPLEQAIKGQSEIDMELVKVSDIVSS